MHGEVIKVGKDKRSGLYVTLRHGDFTVSYCHLSQTLVTKGTHVRPGIIIALTGNSGRSTESPPAPHTQRHKKRTSHRPVHSSQSYQASTLIERLVFCRSHHPFRIAIMS
ncbi:M23 family metallopeptidase [Bacteroides salyersiae]|nr:M23 family metallopeptidase [Bacteroides salyersiae]